VVGAVLAADGALEDEPEPEPALDAADGFVLAPACAGTAAGAAVAVLPGMAWA
jgi:hypothetical protein